MMPAELIVEASALLATGRGEEIESLPIPLGSEAAELWRLAGVHKIRPFLQHHLSRGDAMAREEWIAAQLDLRNSRARSTSLIGATRAAVAMLAEAGIQAVVVKGVTSLAAAFEGLNYRTASDIDILIGSESVNEADRVMIERGFARQELVNRWQAGLLGKVFGRRAYLERVRRGSNGSPETICVDLHWNPRYRISEEVIELDSTAIISRHRAGKGELAGLPIASTEDALELDVAHHLSDAGENRASLRSAIEAIFRTTAAGERAEAFFSHWPPRARSRALELVALSRSSEDAALRRYLATILSMDPGAPPPPTRQFVLSRLSPVERMTYLAGYLVPSNGRGFLEHYAGLSARLFGFPQ